MENKIKKLYYQDGIILLIFLILLWAIIAFVITDINAAIPSRAVEFAVALAGVGVLFCATGAMIAVLAHIKKNRTMIYSEDLENLSKSKCDKDSAS